MSADKVIADVLEEYRVFIAHDFERYVNHAHRVYLICARLDQRSENAEKYAIAAAFHDIGIWTDKTFDYLGPSINQAVTYLKKIERTELIEEVSEMIQWHHKVTSYSGKFSLMVDTFRKADWIDVSMGLVTFGCNRSEISTDRKTYPFKGFHAFLVRKAIGNFFKHPFKPLPMFKV